MVLYFFGVAFNFTTNHYIYSSGNCKKNIVPLIYRNFQATEIAYGVSPLYYIPEFYLLDIATISYYQLNCYRFFE